MTKQPQQIWSTLLKADIVQGSMPEAVAPESPWYVKTLLAFSGWLAALFLLGFIGAGFEFVFKNSLAAFIIGGMMISGAFALLRIPKNEFVEHLGLAASLAGQALVIYALFQYSHHNESLIWLLLALLQATLAIVMPNFVHRVFSSFVAALAFSSALTLLGFPYLSSTIILLMCALLWLNEFHYPQHMSTIRAIGYGLVLALIWLEGTTLFGHRSFDWHLYRDQPEIWTKPWMGEVLMGIVTLYIVWYLLQRYRQHISGYFMTIVLIGTLLLSALSIEVQGITVGIVITLLGFSGSNRILMGLGIVSLLSYISYYYYQLDTTLLSKSGILLLVGLFLLTVRWGMLRFLPTVKEVGDV